MSPFFVFRRAEINLYNLDINAAYRRVASLFILFILLNQVLRLYQQKIDLIDYAKLITFNVSSS